MNTWQDAFGQLVAGRGFPARAGLLLVAAFPLLALVVDKSASVIFAILFLAGLWLLVRRRAVGPDPAMRWVLLAFAAYFLVGVAGFFLGEQTRLGEQLLGRDIRFLGAVPVFFAVRALRPPKSLLVAGIACGGVLAGVVAIGQVALQADPAGRAGGESLSIVFGHLCAALAAVNLALATRLAGNPRWLVLAGGAGAILAVVLSGTRGAVLTVLVVGGVLAVAWCGRRWRRWAAVALGVAGGGVALLLTPAADILGARFAEGIDNLERHVQARAFLQDFSWPAETPACLDAPELLDWMLASGSIELSGGATARVVEPAPAFATAACAGRAFLRFQNPGREHATIRLPERSTPPDRNGGALLVRGEGELRLPGSSFRARVETQLPQRLAPAATPGPPPRHVLVLGPGERLDVLFIRTVPGEYRFMDGVDSINARGYMWQAAYESFRLAPVLGSGPGTFPLHLERRAAMQQGPWQIAQYDHAHSEILTVGVERGVIGLLVLLAVYAAPYRLFRRRRDAFGVAGRAFVAAVFVSGLTETIFNHSIGITYYCTLVLLLAAATEAPAPDHRPPPV